MSTATLQKPIDRVGDDELYEVVDGLRVRKPLMAILSVWIASRLARFLANHTDLQLGRALTEGLFHLPAPINRDRRPDVAFVSYERWPKARSVPRNDDAWNVVPNLTTEVVSPSNRAEELDAKITEYFRAGVQLVWVVYPLSNKIHVYSSPTAPITVLTIKDTLDGGSVVPGFCLPLADLFTEAAEPATSANGEH